MPCCGQKREAIAASYRVPESQSSSPSHSLFSSRGSLRPPVATPPAEAGSSVTLLCRDPGVLSVGGPVTGKRYHFSGTGSMQAVDQQDAEALLATGSFSASGAKMVRPGWVSVTLHLKSRL
jgi:hypothetical protein